MKAQTNQITFENSDTIEATASVGLVMPVVGVYDDAIFQVIITEVSGTTDGTAILQWSVDGTNYKTIAGTDTLDIADVTTQSFIWHLNGIPVAPYYKILCTGVGGTMNAIAVGKAYFRKLKR